MSLECGNRRTRRKPKRALGEHEKPRAESSATGILQCTDMPLIIRTYIYIYITGGGFQECQALYFFINFLKNIFVFVWGSAE